MVQEVKFVLGFKFYNLRYLVFLCVFVLQILPEETIRRFAVDKIFEALSIVEFPIKGQWPPHEAPFFVRTLSVDRHRDIPPSRE